MRARSLKPGFFKNERLAKHRPLTRILFEGLWCMADRDGRLEDRPDRIKVEVLPYDSCRVDAMLSELAAQPDPFIVRYSANGRRYLQILNFSKHQYPHVKEPKSLVPPPDSNGVENATRHRVEHHADNSSETVSRPADSGLLTPDSGLPITDSPFLTAGNPGEHQGEHRGSAPAQPDFKLAPFRPKKPSNGSHKSQFTPPTVEEVEEYARRKNLALGNTPSKFCAYWASYGWRGKQGPMRNWKAAYYNWCVKE